MKFDIVVVGAGPAGSSAAITAARGGAKFYY
jgi:Dehydrogenases (flavoproteins)